jgi:hypothetical protein
LATRDAISHHAPFAIRRDAELNPPEAGAASIHDVLTVQLSAAGPAGQKVTSRLQSRLAKSEIYGKFHTVNDNLLYESGGAAPDFVRTSR